MNAKIVIEVPVELKSMVEPLRRMLETAQTAMRSGRGTQAVDYAKTERNIADSVAAVEAAMHADVLRSLEIDEPRVVIGGKPHSRVGRAAATYYTQAGPVVVERALYRDDRERNGKVVDAISLRTGALSGGWLPNAAQGMAYLVQLGTSREAENAAKAMGRLPYSRASFERVAHAMGEDWLQHHADIEDRLIQELEIPKQVNSMSVGLDRVSIPMEEPARRPVGRPRKDAPKNPITREFRQAYVGTLTLHDRDGNAVYTIRFGCMPGSDPNMLSLGVANAAYRLLEKRPSLHVVEVADGAPEMWNLLEGGFAPELFRAPLQLIDFWHLIEKLSPAAKLIYGEKSGKAAVWRWKRDLLRRSAAAASILAELRLSGKERAWANGEQPVHDAITYLDNHSERMDYAAARRRHLPIGSGNTEATCKTLVAVRMKRAGSRWKNDTGEHILRLRAAALSDLWDDGIALLHETRRTAVRPAA